MQWWNLFIEWVNKVCFNFFKDKWNLGEWKWNWLFSFFQNWFCKKNYIKHSGQINTTIDEKEMLEAVSGLNQLAVMTIRIIE